MRLYRFTRPHLVRGSFLPPGLGGGLHPNLSPAAALDAATSVGCYRVAVLECEQLAFAALFRHELEHCAAIGKPPIVRSSFNDEKPDNFTFLIRPTLRELQDFHLLLDQMMSDNLNQKFFANEGVDPEREVPRSDGCIEVQRKGTIVQLEEWLSKIDFPDPAPRDQLLVVFRKVRKLRQKPAHSPNDNRFDLAYYDEQRQLVIDAYTAIRTLRLILANHPGLQDFNGMPGWLYDGAIYNF